MKPQADENFNKISLCSLKNLSLTWKNIVYTVKKNKGKGYLRDFFRGRQMENVQLLHGVSGIVKSGTLLAILGPR